MSGGDDESSWIIFGVKNKTSLRLMAHPPLPVRVTSIPRFNRGPHRSGSYRGPSSARPARTSRVPVMFAELVVMFVPAVRQLDTALGQRARVATVRGTRRQRRLVRRRADGRRRGRQSGLRGHRARLDSEHAVRVAEPCLVPKTKTIRTLISPRETYDERSIVRAEWDALCPRGVRGEGVTRLLYPK